MPYAGPLTPASSSLPLLGTPDQSQLTQSKFVPIRSTFKPIGQASSSLKKFFPGDEDENSTDLPRPPSPSFKASNKFPGFTASHPTTATPSPLEPPPKIIYERPTLVEVSSPTITPTIPPQMPLLETPPVLPLPPSEPTPQAITPAGSDMAPDVLEDSQPELPRPTVVRDDFYKIVSQVGEGTFGKVYKAENITANTYVALKRIRMESERDGFPVTAMREIKLLQSLRHNNVVQLYEMMISHGKFLYSHV
jgi:CTD kinase subunit alpha